MESLNTCPLCGREIKKISKYKDKCVTEDCLYNDETYMEKWHLLAFIDDNYLDYGNR